MVFGQKISEAGDVIFILIGCDVPVILRPQKDGTYQLIGECYFHGFMKGEAINAVQRNEYGIETVTLS